MPQNLRLARSLILALVVFVVAGCAPTTTAKRPTLTELGYRPLSKTGDKVELENNYGQNLAIVTRLTIDGRATINAAIKEKLTPADVEPEQVAPEAVVDIAPDRDPKSDTIWVKPKEGWKLFQPSP